MSVRHAERHVASRIGWLRAAVLGANDGIVSTASLIVGVAAAEASKGSVILAGAAGLVAGAMSMAAGEYVSVSSQSDAETADMNRERAELAHDPDAETRELAGLYSARGISTDLAQQVALQLMAKDALKAHMRDELGISEMSVARPVQAALTSALTFTIGAVVPLITVLLCSTTMTVPAVTTSALASLAMLGWLGAKAGGAAVLKPVLRVTLWGALALAITAGIGKLFGAVL